MGVEDSSKLQTTKPKIVPQVLVQQANDAANELSQNTVNVSSQNAVSTVSFFGSDIEIASGINYETFSSNALVKEFENNGYSSASVFEFYDKDKDGKLAGEEAISLAYIDGAYDEISLKELEFAAEIIKEMKSAEFEATISTRDNLYGVKFSGMTTDIPAIAYKYTGRTDLTGEEIKQVLALYYLDNLLGQKPTEYILDGEKYPYETGMVVPEGAVLNGTGYYGAWESQLISEGWIDTAYNSGKYAFGGYTHEDIEEELAHFQGLRTSFEYIFNGEIEQAVDYMYNGLAKKVADAQTADEAMVALVNYCGEDNALNLVNTYLGENHIVIGENQEIYVTKTDDGKFVINYKTTKQDGSEQINTVSFEDYLNTSGVLDFSEIIISNEEQIRELTPTDFNSSFKYWCGIEYNPDNIEAYVANGNSFANMNLNISTAYSKEQSLQILGFEESLQIFQQDNGGNQLSAIDDMNEYYSNALSAMTFGYEGQEIAKVEVRQNASGEVEYIIKTIPNDISATGAEGNLILNEYVFNQKELDELNTKLANGILSGEEMDRYLQLCSLNNTFVGLNETIAREQMSVKYATYSFELDNFATIEQQLKEASNMDISFAHFKATYSDDLVAMERFNDYYAYVFEALKDTDKKFAIEDKEVASLSARQNENDGIEYVITLENGEEILYSPENPENSVLFDGVVSELNSYVADNKLTQQHLTEQFKDNPTEVYEQIVIEQNDLQKRVYQNAFGENKLQSVLDEYTYDMSTYATRIFTSLQTTCTILGLFCPAFNLAAMFLAFGDNAVSAVNMGTNHTKNDDWQGLFADTVLESGNMAIGMQLGKLANGANSLVNAETGSKALGLVAECTVDYSTGTAYNTLATGEFDFLGGIQDVGLDILSSARAESAIGDSDTKKVDILARIGIDDSFIVDFARENSIGKAEAIDVLYAGCRVEINQASRPNSRQISFVENASMEADSIETTPEIDRTRVPESLKGVVETMEKFGIKLKESDLDSMDKYSWDFILKSINANAVKMPSVIKLFKSLKIDLSVSDGLDFISEDFHFDAIKKNVADLKAFLGVLNGLEVEGELKYSDVSSWLKISGVKMDLSKDGIALIKDVYTKAKESGIEIDASGMHKIFTSSTAGKIKRSLSDVFKVAELFKNTGLDFNGNDFVACIGSCDGVDFAKLQKDLPAVVKFAEQNGIKPSVLDYMGLAGKLDDRMVKNANSRNWGVFFENSRKVGITLNENSLVGILNSPENDFLEIKDVMQLCVDNGISADGVRFSTTLELVRNWANVGLDLDSIIKETETAGEVINSTGVVEKIQLTDVYRVYPEIASAKNIRYGDFTQFCTIASKMAKKITIHDLPAVTKLFTDNPSVKLLDKMKQIEVIDKLKTDMNRNPAKYSSDEINYIYKLSDDVLATMEHTIQPANISPDATTTMFQGFFANNNQKLDETIKNANFESFGKSGVTLAYSRKDFLGDLNNALSKVSDKVQAGILKKLGITLTQDGKGYDGIIDLTKLDKTNEAEGEVLDLATKFINENEIKTGIFELDTALNSLIKGMPEFINTIGKQQHAGQSYSVDVHILSVLKNAINSNSYQYLDALDKTYTKFVALLHDIAKPEGVKDDFHPELSSLYTYDIIQRLPFSASFKNRITEGVLNHHWLEKYQNSKGLNVDNAANAVAARFRRVGDFEVAKIIAGADIAAIGKEPNQVYLNALNSDNLNPINQMLNRHYQHGQLMFTSRLIDSTKIPQQTIKTANGNSYDCKVLDFANMPEDTNLGIYGFTPGTTPKDLRFFVHMTNSDGLSNLRLLNDPKNDSLLCVSYLSLNQKATLGGDRPVGVILKSESENTANAVRYDQGSDIKKRFEDFEGFLKNGLYRDQIPQKIKDELKLNNQEYVELYAQLADKKYLTQIVEPIVINGKTFEPEVIRQAIRKADDTLLNDRSHNEVNMYSPEIEAVVAKANSIDEVPEYLIKFAQENNYPIYLIGE